MLNNPLVLNGVYAGLGIRIDHTIASMFLDNAGFFSGQTSSSASIQIMLNENKSKSNLVSSGLSMIQENNGYLVQIADKVDDMKSLADQTTVGGLTQEQLEDLQDQFGQLALEIDQLAQGTFGHPRLLLQDGGQESVSVSTSLTVNIETHDMTSSGLKLDQVDLVNDASGAVAVVNAAITEIDNYSIYLESKTNTLDAAQTALEVQRTSLLAAQSAIESTSAAMAVVSMLAGMASNHAAVFLAAQANTSTDTALALLQ